MDHKELLKSCCEEMQVSLTEHMAEQFMEYMHLLLEWNKRMNLTAITDEREVVLKHFADCLSIVPHIQQTENRKLIDVGTGAGFPGIPVKIALPQVSMTLLDSLQKRVGFLQEVTQRLALDDVVCLHGRAEDGGQMPEHREQYDCCVSRAVANLSVLAEYCLPFVRVGGTLVAMKGPEVQEEATQAAGAIARLGGKIASITAVAVPHTDLSHQLVLIEKVAPTPAAYPRRAGKIAKAPLK